MKYYFSADYHLGHFNVIRYVNRPFKTLEEMNETIIRNHNERVKDDDIFIHIGDFCFKNTKNGKAGEGDLVTAVEYEKRLKGKKIFIKGSHDSNNSCKTSIEAIHMRLGGYRLNLVHDPKHANFDYPINLCGHVHEKWLIKRLEQGTRTTDCFNVGCDLHNFYPITIEEILSQYAKWKRNNPKTD